jgi:hypothetical protein
MAGRRMEIAVDPLPDADAAELAELTEMLRSELLDTDVDRVEFPPGDPPPAGAKAVDVFLIGKLIVHFGRSFSVLQDVVATITSWVANHAVRSIKIQLDGDTLEISRATDEQQRLLIDAWLARHTGSSAEQLG